MRSRINHPFDSLRQQFDKQPALIWVLSAVWLAVVCGLAFLWHLGNIGLVDETEPLFAEAARQMTVTGDWVTPYFNGNTRFDKPPLIYWLMAIAYQLIGVNEWAVRLPSALSAIALTVFCFLTLRYFGFSRPKAAESLDKTQVVETTGGGERLLWLAAWIGSAAAALNLQTLLWARTGVSDMLLSGCLGASLLAFFWGYVQPPGTKAKTRWYLAFYVLVALAVLTKGPVGFVLPGFIVGAFALYLGNWRELWQEMKPLQGTLIVLVLAVPWYILVTLANGEAFIDSFFGYHNLERFTRAVNNHKAPWFFYFIVVLLGFTPWSIHLPVAIARLQFWKRDRWQQQPRTAQLGLFALIWFAVIFAFFTIAKTKLPSYTLPLLPAAAILIGLFWSDQMARQRSGRGVLVSSILQIGFLGLLAGVIAYSINWMDGDPAMLDFPDLVQQSGLLVWGSAILASGAVIAALLLIWRQGYWLWLVNLLTISALIVGILLPFMFLVDAQRQLPLRQLAQTITQEQRPKEEVIMVGFPKPSLVFYTEQPIRYVVHPEQLKPGLHHPSHAKRSFLILGLPRKIDVLDLKPNQYQVLQKAGAFELIRVELPLRE
jgi:4-amino-4-deoxy-L-arabinose transferase-like glycosyltransferase